MRTRLNGNQPTTDDFVFTGQTWWKLESKDVRGNWIAVNRDGGKLHLRLYTDQKYLCWTKRAA